MSHPDPLYDSDNSYEDDIMDNEEVFEMDGMECGHEDGYEDDEIDSNYDDYYDFHDDYNDSMDGDHDSAMASAGHGTDEDYGYYGDPEDSNDYGYDDREDFHSDDGCGYYDDGE